MVKMNMIYIEYINNVFNKLLHDGFTIEKQKQIHSYSVDLFGISPVYDMPVMLYDTGLDRLLGHAPYWLTLAIISRPSISIVEIENFSKSVYEYAFSKINKSRFFHRIVLPTIASQEFSDEAKSFVLAFKGDKLRYPIVDAIRPVLINLESDDTYFNSKVTIKYSRTKKIAKEAIEKYLVVDSMKKT
jgi:hypothetical protein